MRRVDRFPAGLPHGMVAVRVMSMNATGGEAAKGGFQWARLVKARNAAAIELSMHNDSSIRELLAQSL